MDELRHCQRLIALLRQLGWKDQQIADALGVNYSTIYRWRTVERRPIMTKLVRKALERLVMVNYKSGDIALAAIEEDLVGSETTLELNEVANRTNARLEQAKVELADVKGGTG